MIATCTKHHLLCLHVATASWNGSDGDWEGLVIWFVAVLTVAVLSPLVILQSLDSEFSQAKCPLPVLASYPYN